MNYKIKVKVGDKREIEIMVYRTLPPIKYELKSVNFGGSGGRPGGFKSADMKEMTDAANAVKDEVLKEAGDEKFSCYDVVSGTKQVVAGMNYQIKVRIGDNKYAQIKVYRSLPPIKYELKSVTFITETTEAPS